MREVERAYIQGQFWRHLFSIFVMAAGSLYARGAGASCTSEVGLTLEDGSWDASFSTRSPFPTDPHTSTPRGSTHHVYSSRNMVQQNDRGHYCAEVFYRKRYRFLLFVILSFDRTAVLKEQVQDLKESLDEVKASI